MNARADNWIQADSQVRRNPDSAITVKSNFARINSFSKSYVLSYKNGVFHTQLTHLNSHIHANIVCLIENVLTICMQVRRGRLQVDAQTYISEYKLQISISHTSGCCGTGRLRLPQRRRGAGDDKLESDDGVDTVSGGNGVDEFYFYYDFDAVTISDCTSVEEIRICVGSGQSNGKGQVRWTGQASGSDWEITVIQKYNNGDDVTEGTIIQTGVSASPGSDIAWSDPEAADGTGRDLLP